MTDRLRSLSIGVSGPIGAWVFPRCYRPLAHLNTEFNLILINLPSLANMGGLSQVFFWKTINYEPFAFIKPQPQNK